MLHPAIEIVIRELTGKMPFEQRSRFFQIVRMGQFSPGLDADGLEFVERISDDSSPRFIEDRLAGLNVPFPSGRVCAFDDILEPPRDIPKLFLDDFLFGDILSFRQQIHDQPIFVENRGEAEVDEVPGSFDIQVNDFFPDEFPVFRFPNCLDQRFLGIGRI
jgi:hypothetical protein